MKLLDKIKTETIRKFFKPGTWGVSVIYGLSSVSRASI